MRGPVRFEELGTTLVHEHLWVRSPELIVEGQEKWDEEREVAKAIRRMRELVDRGVNTIFELTVYGMGRNILRTARVAEAVPELNIIAATGLYTYHSLPFEWYHQGPNTLLGGPEPMVARFEKEITEGIGGTGIKAGLLKCALENDLSDGVERTLRAVAASHKKTGAPITVHTNPSKRTGFIAQRILEEEGIAPGRVIMGHSGDSSDLDYLCRLADAGFMLGMDRFGIRFIQSDETRVATVSRLVKLGYTESIVLSHDACTHMDWLPQGVAEELAPDWNHTHIHDSVLSALLEAGIAQEQLDMMMIGNPRRYLSGVM
ncbi:phosphotriesterase family protein [Streptomyces sp. 8L]|uniref:phosphotriesterase family protein n=1 Tax=Streptomyces sp. 8L TaxID=2877242 RepID=UPI001CD3B033|nr:phosphotriesterase-related protein [Streptomyces sp. 8L]MCA1220215.1 phosphotriesterase-related protein [Streptomyces sp. 8L]